MGTIPFYYVSKVKNPAYRWYTPWKPQHYMLWGCEIGGVFYPVNEA